jgi:hypothetical protein
VSDNAKGCFAEWAPRYREAGFWPRPIKPGTKACKMPEWQRPDDAISRLELDSWLTTYAKCGIGLLMGSPFPDGTKLGALDIDHDAYVRFGEALLRGPSCKRRGKKGIAIFVRTLGVLEGHPKFTVSGETNKEWGMVAECLFHNALCVIPPTQHPETLQSYNWITSSLLEITADELPIVGK